MNAVKEIALYFALAVPYEKHLPPWPYLATPKLNGIRAMWLPGVGFFTRKGEPYTDGILPHIESLLNTADVPMLDGELYTHGLSLQTINGRAGVNRDTPHPEHITIQYHVFDSPNLAGRFVDRQDELRKRLPQSPFIQLLPYKVCNCCDHGNRAHEAFVSMGYEGTVYKQGGSYIAGRSDYLIKRKAWMDDDFEVVEFLEGVGKYQNNLGAVMCRKGDLTFRVGSFAFTDEERYAIWLSDKKPKTAKVKYLGLTEDGRPYNSQVLSLI